MNKERKYGSYREVNAETFNDFLGLIEKLAEYEKLAPPDEEAKTSYEGTIYLISQNIRHLLVNLAINTSLM